MRAQRITVALAIVASAVLLAPAAGTVPSGLAGCGPDASAGTITFEARNLGTEPHELVVVRAADPAALPKAADGTVDERQLPEGALIGEVEAFPAGQTCAGTFELAAGRYALFCNLLETEADGTEQNHYANGMRSSLEVRA